MFEPLPLALGAFALGWLIGRLDRENRCGPVGPPPRLKPRRSRDYCYNPASIAECGGPCSEGGPEACDCGAVVFLDPPRKP